MKRLFTFALTFAALFLCLSSRAFAQNISYNGPRPDENNPFNPELVVISDELAGIAEDTTELFVQAPSGSSGDGAGFQKPPAGVIPDVIRLLFPVENEVDAQSKSVSKIRVLPASYDPRTNTPAILPAIRNQGPFGVCWAFGATALAEVDAVKDGRTTVAALDASADKGFSELHLAWFAVQRQADPLNLITNDKVQLMTDNIDEDFQQLRGNNLSFIQYAESSWTGPVNESVLPYTGAVAVQAGTTVPAANLAYTNQVARMHNSRRIPFDSSDNYEDVKSMLMEKGTLAFSYIDCDDARDSSRNHYYNDGTASNNCGGHVVTLVGWDDNYPNSNFPTNMRPVNNGAWLVRNSWGNYNSMGGYFWMSYEDYSFRGSWDTDAFSFDFEPATKYARNYQYDGSEGSAYLETDAMANVFTAQNDEVIEAVSFSTPGTNQSYKIDIYINPDSGVDDFPANGTSAFSTSQIGDTSYAGLYTIELETPVLVKEGDTFSVVVDLDESATEANGYFNYDATYRNDNWIRFISDAETGQSYMKTADGWSDMQTITGDYGPGNARIKAYTNTPTISVTPTSKTMNAESSSSLLTAVTVPTDLPVTWESNDESIATVDENGNVTPVAAGTATVTATIDGTSISADSAITVVAAGTKYIELNDYSLALEVGNTYSLDANVVNGETADSVTWSSDSDSVGVDENGLVTAIAATGSTPATITAELSSDPDISAECTVSVETNVTQPVFTLNVDNPVESPATGETISVSLAVTNFSSGGSISWELSEESDPDNILTLPESTTGTISAAGSESLGDFVVAANTTTTSKTASAVISFTVPEDSPYTQPEDITLVFNQAGISPQPVVVGGNTVNISQSGGNKSISLSINNVNPADPITWSLINEHDISNILSLPASSTGTVEEAGTVSLGEFALAPNNTPSAKTASVDIRFTNSVHAPYPGLDDIRLNFSVAGVSPQPVGPEFFPLRSFFNDQHKMPGTGFASANFTALKAQPRDLKYADLRLKISIPTLNVDTNVMEVPEAGESWAVEWLGVNIGLLSGSAKPGEGISYMAGHNHLNTTEAGPFLALGSLAENDRIFITAADGTMQSFRIFANETFEAADGASVEEIAAAHPNALVLITCENESIEGGYTHRRVVFAEPC